MKYYKIIVLTLCLFNFNYFAFAYSENTNGEDNLMKGKEFLEQNANNEGVITTESGLQYLVLNQSKQQSQKPQSSDTVTVHYEGRLIDDTVFDSSYLRNQEISFALNQVIAGWTEGLQLMSVGDKFRFFIPSQLAYGSRSMGIIPANSVLIFDVELLGIH